MNTNRFGQQWPISHPVVPVIPVFRGRLHLGQAQKNGKIHQSAPGIARDAWRRWRKTHEYAGYSICLKNFVGATHLRQRPYLVNALHWEEVVTELNLAYRPDLNIADGTKVMVEGGTYIET